MAKAPASRNRESVRFAQRETRVNRCMAIRSFRRAIIEMKWAWREKRAESEPDRAWQMECDAPGGLCGEQSVALHGEPPLRPGNVSFGRGKYACVARERNMRGAGGRADPGASDFCQTSVRLAGQRLDTIWPPRLYSGRWRSPLFLLGVLLRGRGSYEWDDGRNRPVR